MRPAREVATSNGQTYFVTSNTAGRRALFRTERWADLFVETLCSYRPDRFELHAFVVMPDHFHVLITPTGSLERAVQFIKGGFSFKAKRAFDWSHDVWVAGFSDHRIRDENDYAVHLRYIDRNAVKAGLVKEESVYWWASASGRFQLDTFPRGLKPDKVNGIDGAAKAAPFQSGAESMSIQRETKAVPFQIEAAQQARQGNEN
jgi:putative transposase